MFIKGKYIHLKIQQEIVLGNIKKRSYKKQKAKIMENVAA